METNGPWLPEGIIAKKGASDWARQLRLRRSPDDDDNDDQLCYYSPYISTRLEQVARLVILANIRSTDVVCDLGCGEALLLCEIVRLTGCNTTMSNSIILGFERVALRPLLGSTNYVISLSVDALTYSIDVLAYVDSTSKI
jgi:hypothetical protein